MFWNAPTFGVLRPSITNMLFEAASAAEPHPKLLIQGNFGSDPGARGDVKWGTTALTVVHWNPDVVIVRLPAGPTYPLGPIVVAVDGRKSLPARFTEWNLKLTFTLTGPGSLVTTMAANCYLRADVRGFRLMPQEPVRSAKAKQQILDMLAEAR